MLLICDSSFKACDRFLITNASTCPAIGHEGNNHTTDGNTNNNHKDVTTHPFKPYNPSGLESSTVTPLDGGNSEYQYNGTQMKPLAGTQMKSMADEAEPTRKMSLTLGLFIPICLVSCILLWVLYAYRNPHTKSGQLLIQVSTKSTNCLPMISNGGVGFEESPIKITLLTLLFYYMQSKYRQVCKTKQKQTSFATICCNFHKRKITHNFHCVLTSDIHFYSLALTVHS